VWQAFVKYQNTMNSYWNCNFYITEGQNRKNDRGELLWKVNQTTKKWVRTFNNFKRTNGRVEDFEEKVERTGKYKLQIYYLVY